MGTRSNIAYEKENGKVVVMYCHYDGYPEYNGRVLQEHYSHPTQAKALVDNGYQSALKETLEESNEGRVHQEEPKTFSSVHNWLLDLSCDSYIEWVYLFTNNEWKVAEIKSIVLPDGDWETKALHTKDFTPLWAYFTKNNNAVGDQS